MGGATRSHDETAASATAARGWQPPPPRDDRAVLARWEHVRSLRPHLTKALEEARGAGWIGRSNEAGVVVRAPRDMLDALTPLRDALAAVIIVADVRLEAGEEIAVAVTRPRPARCERCRHVLSRRVLPEQSGQCFIAGPA
ncbi:hypothetical protein WS71_08780 [Burkholderia mayonis]|uniref:Uncharacterized protein n=1 Tax=Burkholderia mayonis TaxID=1385591 RepID=A0A1B4FUL6_9BURK|nr:hypothetical protein WS71_08780 [Burkholderia mayonis]